MPAITKPTRLNQRAPWRSDFSTVPAEQRRAARYALQLMAGRPELAARLSDSDFLGALWALCLPLADPRTLIRLQAEWHGPDAENDDEDDCDLTELLSGEGRHLPRGAAGRRMRSHLAECLARVPPTVLQRLAEQDGSDPTHPTVAALAACAGLDATETMLLDFVQKRFHIPAFREFLRESQINGLRDNHAALALALGLPAGDIQRALGRPAALRSLRLVRIGSRSTSDLEDFLTAGELFGDILALEPRDGDALLAAIGEAAPVARWTLADFPHLSGDGERLRKVLSHAAATGEKGVNALLYGAPGTGKTEFAQALAGASGLGAYRVKSADEDGDGLSREGRIGAYLLLQRLLRGRKDCLVIFDEVEDAFGSSDNVLLALFGKTPHAGGDKAWMNRNLEENPVPAVWITNDAASMDPAFLRRFLLPVAFTTPPRSVRQRMAEQHLADTGMPAEVIAELAADDALLPAQFGAARRLLDLQPGVDPAEAVRSGVAASRRLLRGTARPRQRQPATDFDLAYLNLAGGIAPARLADSLARHGQGRLCFYGPPGTGKTEFAHVLADALGRELVVRASSDLVSCYVGETEKNLARLFNDVDAERSVLFLDEVDSLLRDRRQARHSWESTQVNELLQQMERFPGIFIAATNLVDSLDAAALRRFDFKLHFRPLTPPQRLSLFAREALDGDADAVPPALVRRLNELDRLTPGDFANVVRQRRLLDEVLEPAEFLRRLIVECRWKEHNADMIAA